jgi:hypothetical protein
MSQRTIGLTKYLLERMQEMQGDDPAHLKKLKDQYVKNFGQPESAKEACCGEDRELWWLHVFGEYRVERMRQSQSGRTRSKR